MKRKRKTAPQPGENPENRVIVKQSRRQTRARNGRDGTHVSGGGGSVHGRRSSCQGEHGRERHSRRRGLPPSQGRRHSVREPLEAESNEQHPSPSCPASTDMGHRSPPRTRALERAAPGHHRPRRNDKRAKVCVLRGNTITNRPTRPDDIGAGDRRHAAHTPWRALARF